MIKISKKEFIADYEALGSFGMADKYKCSVPTILNKLKLLGVPVRGVGRPKKIQMVEEQK